MLSRFNIISQDYIEEMPKELSIGTLLSLKEIDHYYDRPEKQAFCIVPSDFMKYIDLVYNINSSYIVVDSIEERNNHSIDDYLNRDFMSPPLMTFIEALNSMLFVEMILIENDRKNRKYIFKIENIIEAKKLWEYWIPRNTYHNPAEMQHLGLGQKIFDLVPPNHHYFDMSYICTCGVIDCYNYIPWYIKKEDSYIVGFVIQRFGTLEFNSKHEDYSPEQYVEVIDRINMNIDHNKKLQELNEYLLVNDTDCWVLDEADRLIVMKGEMDDWNPYLYEFDGNCLYHPLLGSNADIGYLEELINHKDE